MNATLPTSKDVVPAVPVPVNFYHRRPTEESRRKSIDNVVIVAK